MNIEDEDGWSERLNEIESRASDYAAQTTLRALIRLARKVPKLEAEIERLKKHACSCKWRGCTVSCSWKDHTGDAKMVTSKHRAKMIDEARDHFFEAYREIQPVILALEELVKALETFNRKVGHMPCYSLGLAHYKWSVKEAKKFKDDAYNTACAIGKLSKDGQDGQDGN